MASEEAPVVTEIAHLLDQCSPEELTNILQAIENGPLDGAMGVAEAIAAECVDNGCGAAQSCKSEATLRAAGGPLPRGPPQQPGAAAAAAAAAPTSVSRALPEVSATTVEAKCRSCGNSGTDFLGQPCACAHGNKARSFDPVPPAAPPPGGRRPVPAAKLKKEDAEPSSLQAQQQQQQQFSIEDVKALLNQHSAMVLGEVRKMIPGSAAPQSPQAAATEAAVAAMGGSGGEGVDLDTLTRILAERDREVKELEGRLADLQDTLAQKDKHVADLGGELDSAIREVRHRQLDLEFQQLKLEERVRSNAELEQAQRVLSARVEEATLNARHAAIDVEMCRSTPRAVRVQGTLPWTLRKNRIGGAMT